MLKEYIANCKRRLLERVTTVAVVAPLLLIYATLTNGFDYASLGTWLALVIGLLFLVIGVQFAWLLYFEPPPPPTAAQRRQQQLSAAADSVDGLPGGMSLADLCEKLDEKQTRKLIHQLHQIRPGSRHLRDVVGNVSVIS